MSGWRRICYAIVGLGWGISIFDYWINPDFPASVWGRFLITIALAFPTIDYCLASITGTEPP